MASDQFLSLHGRRQQLVAISADRRRSAPERFIYFHTTATTSGVTKEQIRFRKNA